MNNSVFNQFIVVLACFTFLIGAAAIAPSYSNTQAVAEQSIADLTKENECRGAEVYDTELESCIVKLNDEQVQDLDTVISGTISDTDLANRIIADENKPRVDPNSPEEIKKREQDFATRTRPKKSEDQDLLSKKTGLSAYVVISKIKVTTPIVFTTGFDIQTGDWACLGPNCPMRYKLAKGVLHIAGYPEPGEKGNSIIVGHSSAYASEPGDYKTVFAKINELAIGDTFEIRYSNNKVQKFRVFESFEYKLSNALSNNPSQESNDASNKRNNRYANDNVVTLETCWPLGSNKDRWVVQAKLI